MTERTTEELLERRDALKAEFDAAVAENRDLTEIEKESKAVADELERRRAEETRKAELREKVADGEGTIIKEFKEERENKMDIKEIRNSKEYLNAWANGVKKENFAECRKLLTENGIAQAAEGDGIVPVPAYVENRMRALFENNALLNRIRKTYYKGNLKVGFEVSSTGAVAHNEGAEAIDDEQLVIGTCNLIPVMLKKSIAVSDEVLDMRGEEFLDYLFDEFTNKIEALLVEGLITAVTAAPTTSTTSAVGVPEVEASAVTLDIVAQAMAEIVANNANPILIMNRGTYAAFRSAQLNANYAVDPFEGCEIFYSSVLPAVGDATTSDTWLIVIDPTALQANFPNGSEVKFTYDPYTLAKADLVQITGRLYVALGITAPGYACKVVVGE